MQNKIRKVHKKLKTKDITMIAMLSAISAVLMVLEIQLSFSPSFIKFDFSDLPVMLGGFLLGPLAGILIACIKILLNFLLNGTTTMFVGELSNLILALAFVVPASYIYKKEKTKKNAIKGLVVSIVLTCLLAIVSNIFVIFPLYGMMFGMTMNEIVGMVIATNPLVKDIPTMIIFSLLPFNIFKYSFISLITMITYKKLSYFFRKEGSL